MFEFFLNNIIKMLKCCLKPKFKNKVERLKYSLNDFILANNLHLNLTLDEKAKAMRAEIPMTPSVLAEYKKYFT
jgi:hypothetical protein